MWIWFLGEPEEAKNFKCEIAIKKKNRDEDTELKGRSNSNGGDSNSAAINKREEHRLIGLYFIPTVVGCIAGNISTELGSGK